AHQQGESRARRRMLRGALAAGVEELLAAGRRSEALGRRNPAFMAWRSKAALALLQLGEWGAAGGLAGGGMGVRPARSARPSPRWGWWRAARRVWRYSRRRSTFWSTHRRSSSTPRRE